MAHHRTFIRRGPLMACITLMLAQSAWQAAHAATYRCEIPSTQAGVKPEVRYQSQACEGGRAVPTADHRTDAQRTDIAKATQSNAKLGRELERERHRQEKKSAGQLPVAMDAVKPKAKAPENTTQGQTLKRHRPFTARIPKVKANAPTPSN